MAEAHGAHSWLQDRQGGGLCARVILPRARPVYPRALLAAAAMLAGLLALPPAPARAAGQEQSGDEAARPLPSRQEAAPVRTPESARPATQQATAPPQMQGMSAPLTITRFLAPQPTDRLLVIAGTTDTPAAAPVIIAFQAIQPDVTVEYREMGSRELYEATVAGQLRDTDVLVSSAADLQIRLANDGYAMRYDAPGAERLPSWAVWRDEVFGFAFEPAVIAYNPRRFTEATVPRSRQELLRLLEAERAKLHGRVGTYDISRSSVGQVLAEEDEQVSSNFWGLTNALGQVGVRLSATTADILNAIENDRTGSRLQRAGFLCAGAPSGRAAHRRDLSTGLRPGAATFGADRTPCAPPGPGPRVHRLAAFTGGADGGFERQRTGSHSGTTAARDGTPARR